MDSKNLRTHSRILKSLAHLKRLEIITLLHGHSLTVNQISQMTSLRQASVSQHLMELKGKGLAKSYKEGKEIYYTLSARSLTTLADFLRSLTRAKMISTTEPTVIDPVCHMHLTPTSASYSASYNGVRQYFCGKGCLKDFIALHQGAR